MSHRTSFPIALALRCAALCTVLLSAASAQNLVVNPSFETYSSCPSNPGQITLATGWNSPNTGSPDYDHVCGTGSTVQVPTNLWGTQSPKTGSAYAQVITYVGASASNFREYIQAPLTSPLAAGTSYEVSFWVSRGEGTRYACADIGAYLSVGAVGPIPNFNPLPVTPQVQNGSGVLTDSVNWVQIKGTFVAAGGESHIVIGNFKNHANSTATQLSPTGHNNASYYIDDVRVVELDGPTVSTSHLVGWADLPSASFGYLDMQEMNASCPSAFSQCLTSFPKQAYTPWAGGTAYDPRYQTVWVSDGAVLAEFYVQPGQNCKARCPVTKAVIQHSSALVSGLACADRKSRLFQLATYPGAMEIATYDNSNQLAKCLGKYSVCRLPLPGEAVATGLAFDEPRDLLYINIAVPQPTGYVNVLMVTKASSPCTQVCQLKYFSCNTNLVTGLAYDACSKTIYATDGQTTQTYQVLDPYQCKFALGACCAKQTNPVWRGLAIVPGWSQNHTGSSCTSGSCGSCPSMAAFTNGDPSLGSNFQIGLQNAPANSFGALYFKLGPPGPGLALPPPFCGTWYGFPTIFSYPPTPVGGTTGCSGNLVVGLPIPPAPPICGVQLTVQWFVLCPGTSFGLGFSQALDFTIATS